MANPDEPFNASDIVAPGQEDWPFLRLICGYAIPDGYVVEREQSGRGYNIRTIVFRKTAVGFKEQ